MYKSPIAFMLTEKQAQMENGVLKALQDVGIIVDKDELMKAMAYDRNQYQKGFADGREAGREWISVEDRLPENRKIVLTYSKNNGFIFGAYTEVGWIFGKFCEDPTHWMPRPEPPQEE